MIFAGSEEIAVEAFRLGAKRYVVKPLKPHEVTEAVEDALREGRLRREKQMLTEQLMRANKQLEQRVRELIMLYNITQAMTKALDLETLLSRVVEASVFLTNADEGMLFLIDEDSDEIYLRAAKGVGDKRASMLLLPAHDSVIGQVVKTGQPLRIASSESRLDFTVKTGYMVNSLLYVPLKFHGDVKGVLTVSNRVTDRGFTRTDQSRLDLLADHAVIALENARLYEATRERIADVFGHTLSSLCEYVYHPLKAFATNTYALKAAVDRGIISSTDDTLFRLLSSMERSIEQMASVTEILSGLVSPESTADDWEQLGARFEKVKTRYAAP
jgi:two-component system NtrC family sensor kinase